MTDKFQVEVAYARPQEQIVIPLQVQQGTTLQEAIDLSGILLQFQEIDLSQSKTGVFGRILPLDTVCRAGDRIEIYRPLIADPKTVRRRRAAGTGKKNAANR